MELFILKLTGIICITILAIAIIIARKDDIEITSVFITIIFEIIALCIIYVPIEKMIELIEKLINI